MKVLSLSLIALLLLVLLVLNIAAQSGEFRSAITTSPYVTPQSFFEYYLPFVRYYFAYLTPTQTFTSTATSTPTITPSLTSTPTISQTLPLDLIVATHYEIKYDYGCPWGSPGQIISGVSNVGLMDAGPFIVEYNHHGYPGMKTTPTLIPGLPANTSTTLYLRFDSGPAGGVYVNVDPDNLFLEMNEGNKLFYILFTPPPWCTPPPTLTATTTP